MAEESTLGESQLKKLPLKLQLRIIGDDAEKTTKIEENITEILIARGIPFDLELVNKPEMIQQVKPLTKPALWINQKEIDSSHLYDKVKLNEHIDEFIQGGEFKLRKIIIPTDFSTQSENACRCALQWAKKWNATFEMVYVIPPYVDGMNPESAMVMAEQQNILLNSAEKSMNEWTNRLQSETGQVVHSHIMIGEVAYSICEYAYNSQADMIVMGATGQHGLLDKLFGSVSSSVAKNSKVPVLFIPHQISSIQFKHILYSSDYSSASLSNIFYVLRMAHGEAGKVDFIHVSENKPIDAAMKELRFKRLLEELHPQISYKFEIIQNDHIADSLYQYAYNHEIDVLVTVHKNRDLWGRLMEKSLSGKLVFEAKFPILVLQN